MTEIKTAQAWCFKYDDALHPMEITPEWISPKQVPVAIIEAYSVSDIIAGLALLTKSREVCEYRQETSGRWTVWFSHSHPMSQDLRVRPYFCPVEGCGRAVKITEGE